MTTKLYETVRNEVPSVPTTGESTDDVTGGPKRGEVIELSLPGEHDDDHRLVRPRSLKPVVDHALQPSTQVDQLELLLSPGDNQYRHYLRPVDTASSTADIRRCVARDPDSNSDSDEELVKMKFAIDPADTTADEHETEDADKAEHEKPDADLNADDAVIAPIEEDNDTTKTVVGTVTNALDEYCPEVDYAIGTLDLSSLAAIPVPTSRLLAVEDQTLDVTDGAPTLGAIELLDTLIREHIPHLYQLLIKRAGSRSDADYEVSVRLAVFDEEYGVATDDDLTAHLNPATEYEYCISQPFRDQLVTSNFELPIEAFKQAVTDDRSSRYRTNGQPNYLIDRPFPIEELATFREYANLLSGAFVADPRYKRHFDRYAHLPVNGASIDQLACILPAYFGVSPWDRTAVTDGPTFRTERVPTSATTTLRYGDVSLPDPKPDATDKSTSEAHRALVNRIVNYLVQQGYTILAVDQNTLDTDLTDPDPTTRSQFPGDSQPDIVAKKDGEITVFEAELNKTNPAAFLKNLERAAHFGYDVVVVTEQPDTTLEQKIKQASRPFNDGATPENSRHGVRLYNFSEVLLEADGTTYLLPAGSTETKWYLSHDDELILVVDGTPIARGHPEDPLPTFLEGIVPHYREDGDAYVVTFPSGETERYATEDDVTAKYTPIKRPFIPTQITYCEDVEFRYKDDSTNHLKRYYPTPDWARRYRDKSGKRHKASRTEFIESHTRKVEGETLFIPDVRVQHTPWHTTQTELDPPKQNWFGRDIQTDFEASDTDSRDRELLNRTWLYTPGLDPAFPDFPDP